MQHCLQVLFNYFSKKNQSYIWNDPRPVACCKFSNKNNNRAIFRKTFLWKKKSLDDTHLTIFFKYFWYQVQKRYAIIYFRLRSLISNFKSTNFTIEFKSFSFSNFLVPCFRSSPWTIIITHFLFTIYFLHLKSNSKVLSLSSTLHHIFNNYSDFSKWIIDDGIRICDPLCIFWVDCIWWNCLRARSSYVSLSFFGL